MATAAQEADAGRDGGTGALSSAATTTIKIKSPSWPVKDLVLDLDPSLTVRDVKTRIRRQLADGVDDLPESAQRLIFGGQVLADDRTLADLKLPANATVHLATSISPRPRPAVDQEAAAPAVESPAQCEADTPSTPQLNAPPQAAELGATAQEASTSRTARTQTQQPATNRSARPIAHDGIVNMGFTYDVQMINGYPYLVQRAQGHSRTTRANGDVQRDVILSSQGSMRARRTATADAAQYVNRGHIELPASSAFRARGANGQRAVVLSPDAVRMLQNRGIQVDRGLVQGGNAAGINPRLARFVIDPQRVAEFFRTAMPHGMLLVKLFVLVALLGTNATWSRLCGLVAAAFIIFMWQSGLVARVLEERQRARAAAAAGQTSPQPQPQTQPHQPQTPAQAQPRPHTNIAGQQQDTQAQAQAQGAAQGTASAVAQTSSQSALNNRSNSTSAQRQPAPAPPSLLATVATAFVSSLLPGMESALAAGGAPAEVAPIAQQLPAVEAAAIDAARSDAPAAEAAESAAQQDDFLTDADTAPGGSEAAVVADLAAHEDTTLSNAGARHDEDEDQAAGGEHLTDADVAPGGSEHAHAHAHTH